MDDAASRHREGEGAYSLIEVIVASGLLAGILISIAAALVVGTRLLHGGGNLTRAATLAQDIIESLETRSFTGLYGALGAGPGDIARRVESAAAGSPLASWQPEISRRLPGGAATATVEAIGPEGAAFGEAAGIRLTIEIAWREAGRRRHVTFRTVRF